MDPISILAASGLRARIDALDMLANNLANGATAGYKTDRESYSRYISEQGEDVSDDDSATGSLPVIGRQWTDFSQGTLQPTSNPLDFGLSGKGFFAVNGPNGTLYTRNGSFRVSSSGTLETADGYAVESVGGGTIQTHAGGAIEISTDGTVRQKGQPLGRIAVVDFADPSKLVKQTGTYFRAAAQATPTPAKGTEIRQGTIESSNVVVAESAVRMVGLMRQFEMLQKAITLSGNMGRKAVEEVARINS